jgi:hypothetical protein
LRAAGGLLIQSIQDELNQGESRAHNIIARAAAFPGRRAPAPMASWGGAFAPGFGSPSAAGDYSDDGGGTTDDEDDGEDGDVACSCCRAAGARGGPFALPSAPQQHSDAGWPLEPGRGLRSRGGAGGADSDGADALLPPLPAGAPTRRLKASLRSEFQSRFAERIGNELFGMSNEEARASFELCTRLLGISWTDDEEEQAGGAGAGSAGQDAGGAAGGAGPAEPAAAQQPARGAGGAQGGSAAPGACARATQRRGRQPGRTRPRSAGTRGMLLSAVLRRPAVAVPCLPLSARPRAAPHPLACRRLSLCAPPPAAQPQRPRRPTRAPGWTRPRWRTCTRW